MDTEAAKTQFCVKTGNKNAILFYLRIHNWERQETSDSRISMRSFSSEQMM